VKELLLEVEPAPMLPPPFDKWEAVITAAAGTVGGAVLAILKKILGKKKRSDD
jgi:hypothetical protein